MSQQRARGNNVQVTCEAMRQMVTSENGTPDPRHMVLLHEARCSTLSKPRKVDDDLLHKTLQNIVLGEDLEDVARLSPLPRRRRHRLIGLVPPDLTVSAGAEQEPPPRECSRHDSRTTVLINTVVLVLLLRRRGLLQLRSRRRP